MTKEEFEVLQLDLQQSGKSVKDYLHDAGVNYSTYNYWRKKLLACELPVKHNQYLAIRLQIYDFIVNTQTNRDFFFSFYSIFGTFSL